MKTFKAALITSTAALVALGSMATAANAGDRGQTRGEEPATTEIAPAPTRPGGDPPYDPGRGPGDIAEPWSPPSGPGDYRDPPSEPTPPPTGPGSYSDAEHPFNPELRVTPVPEGCIGGKMIDYSHASLKWLASSGWQVRIWVYESSANSEQPKAEHVRQLNSDGEWTYCLPGNYFTEMSREFLFVYESQNPLLRLEETRYGDKDLLWWFGPHNVHTDPPANGIYTEVPHMPSGLDAAGINVGTFKLDTGPQFVQDPEDPKNPEAKALNPYYAVGDVMRWGMQALDKMQAVGLKADRTIGGDAHAPHELLYPMSDCGACYNQTDNQIKIDLDPDHVDRFTVQHELGHSVTDEYWAGDDMAYGPHDIASCEQSLELAWVEGIADFFAVWAHNDDMYALDPSGDQFNAESPVVAECGTIIHKDHGQGAHAEEYVAGALWDLHDHIDDAEDTLGLKHMQSALALVLTHKVDHAPAMRSHYVSMMPDEFDSWANAVFGMNNIPPKEWLT